MFYVNFLVAFGINQAAVAEVTSENIQQTKSTSLAESVIETFALNTKTAWLDQFHEIVCVKLENRKAHF